MKWLPWASAARGRSSLPVRGAWVEMPCVPCIVAGLIWSLPVRGAWVEMGAFRVPAAPRVMSLPVRGAWVEILLCVCDKCQNIVAPRAGSVG